MLSFIDELQKHYDLVIYLIIGVIFIFFLIVFFLFFNKKKKYMNKLEKLKAEFKKIDELPITTALTKIEELGMRNISFSSMSSIYVKRYLDYSDKFNQPINDMIASISAMINEGKYDFAEERIEELRVLISGYKKDAESLLGDIQDATKDEEPLLRDIERVRKVYHECIKKYQDNASDLSLVYGKIRGSIEKVDSLISEAEDNVSSGIYIETKEIINKVDEELSYLTQYLKVMPSLINFATNTIVRNLNDLIEKNNIMQQDYPIHHLKPIKTIERLKYDVESAMEKIKVLDYDGIEPLLLEINKNIIDLSDALDNEKACKKEYDNKCENLYYTSDCTIRNFDHSKKEIQAILEDYECSEEITQFLNKCDEYQKQLKDDKQIMDNNIYGHQPYSVRLENMNKLNTTIADFQAHLDSLSEIANQLSIDRNECISKIKGYINYLRLSQITLDNCNLPALSKKYREKITNIEELISRLVYSLKRPYKIKFAKEICNTLDVECKDLYGKVRYSQKLMIFTEKIIVIAARYRDKFQEVDYAVNRATFYFLDGDFESSKNIIEKLSIYGIAFPKFSEVEVK